MQNSKIIGCKSFNSLNIIIYDIAQLLYQLSFPVAQLVEHGVSNAKIMGSIPRESKSC